MYLQDLTRSDLEDLLYPLSQISRAGSYSEDQLEKKKRSQAQYRAKQIFNWVYQRFVTDWDEMSDLSKSLREWLKANLEIYQIQKQFEQQSVDGTHKFLWSLHDKKTIESVIIPAALDEKATMSETLDQYYAGAPTTQPLDGERWSRLTICISSQVGCAMACKFCLTGIQGLDRHLQTHEVVSQVLELRKRAPLTNIVFMGMGEPLHNLDHIIKACQIFLDQQGMNFSKRKVTVSTSGLVPAIEKLGQNVDVSLAISLNATTDEIRSQIMPVNKKWNIETLLKACREFPLGKHRFITFEYVLLKGINDSLEDAKRLVKISRSVPCKINLIPFNEHPGSEFKRPDDQAVKEFHRHLLKNHVTATVRISRGRDILAACGQLRSIFGTARGSDRHKDWKTPVSTPASAPVATL